MFDRVNEIKDTFWPSFIIKNTAQTRCIFFEKPKSDISSPENQSRNIAIFQGVGILERGNKLHIKST